jgi:hypothetical protein
VVEGAALTLEQAAGLAGGYRWIEHRLFELTGAWSLGPGADAARLHLFEVSGQHAWHAALWAERLPALAGHDPAALTAAPAPAAGPLLDALAGIEDGADEAGVCRLSGLYRVVVPRLVVSYRRHLHRAVPVSDRPTIRALRLVLRDEAESWLTGERLIEEALTGEKTAVAAAETQRRLEALVVASGVGPGLVPWPAADFRHPPAGPS